MHAIIVTGGKQYKVAEGETLFIEKLPCEAGDAVTFDKVLAVIDGDKITGEGFDQRVLNKAGITRADASAHYRELAAHHVPDEAATEIERVLVDGDDAVVFGEIRQTARSTGRPYRARFALLLTVRDGLVVRHHVYEDSLSVHRAFAPRPTAGS